MVFTARKRCKFFITVKDRYQLVQFISKKIRSMFPLELSDAIHYINLTMPKKNPQVRHKCFKIACKFKA